MPKAAYRSLISFSLDAITSIVLFYYANINETTAASTQVCNQHTRNGYLKSCSGKSNR